MASRKVRLVILTGSVTAITVLGAWYGAGLKSHQEQAQVWNFFQLEVMSYMGANLEIHRQFKPAEKEPWTKVSRRLKRPAVS